MWYFIHRYAICEHKNARPSLLLQAEQLIIYGITMREERCVRFYFSLQ